MNKSRKVEQFEYELDKCNGIILRYGFKHTYLMNTNGDIVSPKYKKIGKLINWFNKNKLNFNPELDFGKYNQDRSDYYEMISSEINELNSSRE